MSRPKSTDTVSDKDKKSSNAAKAEAKNTIVSASMKEFKLLANQGTDEKGDVRVIGFQESLNRLNEMIAKMTESEPSYNFSWAPVIPGVGPAANYVPHAFLYWVHKSADKKLNSYNVSRAFRRLQKYTVFMEENKHHLAGITVESTREFFRESNCYNFVGNQGHVVMIMDLDDYVKLGVDADKDQLGLRMFRCYTYILHEFMADAQCQKNGLLFLMDYKFMGMMDMAAAETIASEEWMDKIRNIFMGIAPIKMKKFYSIHNPWFLRGIMFVIKPFLSDKIIARFAMLDADDWKNVVTREIGEVHESFGAKGVKFAPDFDGKDRYYRKTRSEELKKAVVVKPSSGAPADQSVKSGELEVEDEKNEKQEVIEPITEEPITEEPITKQATEEAETEKEESENVETEKEETQEAETE